MNRIRVDGQAAREMNRATVFDLLRRRHVASRIGLVRETGFSKATISQIVDQFIREGLVQTVGPGEAGRGRRPTLLRMDPHARVAIGVELGDAVCNGVLADLNGDPIRSVSEPVGRASPDTAIAAAAAVIERLADGLPAGKLLGIGVGTPGMVDSRLGVIRTAPDLGWEEVAVGPALADRFRAPLVVLNRAKAAAVGEAWCGAGKGVDNLVYVSVSTGISSGIVIDGRLYRGVSMGEGEIGHMTVIPDGPLCACGNRGCLQTVAAGPAILARVRAELRERTSRHGGAIEHGAIDRIDLDDVSQAAAVGDSVVLAGLEEAAQFLGIAVANLVNTLNPRMVIVGGSVIRALPVLVPRIEAVIRRRALSIPGASVAVVPSQLGRGAVALGAAAFLFSQVSVVGSSQLLHAASAFTPSVIRPTAAATPDAAG